ncbi:ribosomal protein S18-alanine N-acetyltransferase [Kribbella lupini]|uniref:[Ribosomal protein bS18]-alanine N-acetyltransferase n=1 Tax=Kribbella lupini TaxID=291602 RepID=A0ABP4N365_9ACTN
MSIRPALPSDQPAVVALDTACFPKDAWNPESWSDEFTRADRRILVADESTLAGYVVLLVPPVVEDPVDLLRIAVDPAYRRTGLGRRLLAAALDSQRARTVLLEVAAGNDAAIGLYAGFGFREISRRRGYYTGGEDAVVMQRAGDNS